VRIWFSETRRTSVLVLDAEYDLLAHDALRSALVEACAAERQVLVDFRAVTFIDSSGVGIIVGAYRRCAQEGKQLLLLNVSGPPLRVITMLGLKQLLWSPPQPRASASEPAGTTPRNPR
jgi:stage II sporulation protein AA (anti-sigma F factor antagonist)